MKHVVFDVPVPSGRLAEVGPHSEPPNSRCIVIAMKTISGYTLTIATCVVGAGLKRSLAFVRVVVKGALTHHHQAQHASLPVSYVMGLLLDRAVRY